MENTRAMTNLMNIVTKHLNQANRGDILNFTFLDTARNVLNSTNTVLDSNIANTLNTSISQKNKNIESYNLSKTPIKRDYKLTTKYDVGLWLNSFKLEIRSLNTLDVIDDTVDAGR